MRVLVVGKPGLLRDIVAEAVASEPDMELAPDQRLATGPLAPAQRTDARVIICIVGESDARTIDDALREVLPQRALLAIRQSGQQACLYDYDPRVVVELRGDLSLPALLDVLRRHTQDGWAPQG